MAGLGGQQSRLIWAWLGLAFESPDFLYGKSLHHYGAGAHRPSSPLPTGAGQSPWERALAHCPIPVTLGFLDQQSGCCAEIQGTKGPTASKGGGGVWAALLHAGCDNQSFQSTEAEYQPRRGQRGILGSGAREEPDNSWEDNRVQVPDPS